MDAAANIFQGQKFHNRGSRMAKLCLPVYRHVVLQNIKLLVVTSYDVGRLKLGMLIWSDCPNDFQIPHFSLDLGDDLQWPNKFITEDPVEHNSHVWELVEYSLHLHELNAHGSVAYRR